jgi:hypothetical protein
MVDIILAGLGIHTEDRVFREKLGYLSLICMRFLKLNIDRSLLKDVSSA